MLSLANALQTLAWCAATVVIMAHRRRTWQLQIIVMTFG